MKGLLAKCKERLLADEETHVRVGDTWMTVKEYREKYWQEGFRIPEQRRNEVEHKNPSA